jgi:hypothetical protein
MKGVPPSSFNVLQPVLGRSTEMLSKSDAADDDDDDDVIESATDQSSVNPGS